MKRFVKYMVAVVALVVASMLPTTPSVVQEAQAQAFECNDNFCTYGPFCVDAWGGCFYYSWWIGSGVNTVGERSGIADILKLCDPANPTSTNCVKLNSQVKLVKELKTGSTTEFKPNVYYQCRAPGADTCTDASCGGSPSSSGNPFVTTIDFQNSATSFFGTTGCVKERASGAIKCSKTNSVPILEAQAAQLCPNANWKLVSWPLVFEGTSEVTGPISKRDPRLIRSTLTAKCYLKDDFGRLPGDAGYLPNPNPLKNSMVCSANVASDGSTIRSCLASDPSCPAIPTQQ